MRWRFFQLGEKGLFIGRHQVDHEARGLVVARIEHERFVDQERSADIEHDARLARREQAITEGGDEPPLLGAETGRHLEAHVGRIDDDAVGIAESEDMHVDLTREVGDEAGAPAVASKPRILGDRMLGLCRGIEMAENQGRKRKQAGRRPARAQPHISRATSASLPAASSCGALPPLPHNLAVPASLSPTWLSERCDHPLAASRRGLPNLPPTP